MGVDIYRGNTEYYCQLYEQLWIIQRQGVGIYLKSDFIDSLPISVILIASIIKRNYQPSQWFSDNPILGQNFINRIMRGRKFLCIMSYLHVCDMNKQASKIHPEYDRFFKVREFQKNS